MAPTERDNQELPINLACMMAMAVGVGTGSGDEAIDTVSKMARSNADRQRIEISRTETHYYAPVGQQVNGLELLRTKLGWEINEADQGSRRDWVPVTLPVGWTTERVGSYHTEIHDDKKRNRGTIVNGNFWDDQRTLQLKPRFFVDTPLPVEKGMKETRNIEIMDNQSGKAVFVACSIVMPNTDKYKGPKREEIVNSTWRPLMHLKDDLRYKIKAVVARILPEYEDSFAYWDQDVAAKVVELQQAVKACVDEFAAENPLLKEALVPATDASAASAPAAPEPG